MSETPLTPEDAKALADKVIEASVIPKKVPEVDDVDGQTKALGGALSSALLTATDMPLHMLSPVVADLASQMVALGIRQTEHIDPTALHAPAWITQGVREQSVKIPDPPQHTEADPIVTRTETAPDVPKRIAKRMRATRL